MTPLAYLHAVEQPKITDWMQGWGSFAGVLVSLVAVVITGFLLRHEMKQARDAQRDAAQERELARSDREFAAAERRDAEANHARTVLITQRNYTGRESKLRPGNLEITEVTGAVSNFGTAPILHVEVKMVGTGRLSDVAKRVKRVPMVAQNGREAFQLRVDPIEVTAEEQASNPLFLALEITFTDVNGLRWRRRDDDQPERVLRVYPAPPKITRGVQDEVA